ncbi:MAG: glycine--tRNA ligase subunit beta [Clostridia bacterium]|jgi:glycyl-tRNA synthetase beta chain|nr:glycine--tRNA ligase subunit beta [Clostridia bacterium]
MSNKRSNYLLEIGTEEIPAKFMSGILTQLQDLAEKQFSERRIACQEIKIYGTPRRIALLAYGLADKGEDVTEEVKGPAKKAAYAPDGRPTKAAEGFARGQGVTVEALYLKNLGGAEYVYAQKEIKGQATREVLPEIACQLIGALNFPKPMRWAAQEMRFARPIRWLVSLLDREVIPFELAGLTAGQVSRGHRILGQESLTITDPLSYLEQLEQAYVLADQEKRRAECWRQIQATAAELGGNVEEDEELLNEVTYLLEWPTALGGTFDADYLTMPDEVIITPMREHQRYFPVRSQDGKLLNYFVTVRNGDDRFLEIVRAGNEKVLKARLADARFFWEEDKKQNLAGYLPRLEKIVFQESLGTVAQKVARNVKNVEAIARLLDLTDAQKQQSLRAAELAKADLVTNMVYEFPELQGIMGRYYALLSGEGQEVADAIKEHYQPRFAGDAVPPSLAGALVSIADKLDTITGCFAVGIEPTGSQDPYALRRQAMGVCLTIIGHKFELALDELIALALNNYAEILPPERLGESGISKIKEFFQARVRNILSEEGHRYDVADAVLGVDYNLLMDTLSRAEALSRLKENTGFMELLTSFTRAYNLTKKSAGVTVEEALLTEAAEQELYKQITSIEGRIQALAASRDYAGVIQLLSSLGGPIAQFFNETMVMVEDERVRDNRLALLKKVVHLSQQVGDLSKIVSQ